MYYFTVTMQGLASTQYAAQAEQTVGKLKRSKCFKELHEFY